MIQFSTRTGSFNWANPRQVDTLAEIIVFGTGGGVLHRVGERFGDNENVPSYLKDDPSGSALQVLDLIEKKVNSYWISTSRERDLANIAKARAFIEANWYALDVATLEAEARPLRNRLGWIDQRLATLAAIHEHEHAEEEVTS